jgi:hypothetical protein
MVGFFLSSDNGREGIVFEVVVRDVVVVIVEVGGMGGSWKGSWPETRIIPVGRATTSITS